MHGVTRLYDAARFFDAMASFPSGVTIVTTADENGRWWGFTATSFCSVSKDPPLVLVCLAQTAECFPAFKRAENWRIHILSSAHAPLALRFATRGADKFGSGVFRADDRGIPVLDRACVTLSCSVHDRHDGGDHMILVGQVESVDIDNEQTPTTYYRRAFVDFAADQ